MDGILSRFKRLDLSAALVPVLLALAGVVWGVLLARLPILDALLVTVLAAVVVGSLWEPLVGVGAALFLGPMWAWLRAELPQIPPLIGQMIFLLAVAIWVLRGLLRRDVRIPFPPLLIPLLLFMGAALLSLWQPVDVWAGLLEFGKWGQILLMFLVIYERIRGAGGRRRVVAVVMMLAVVVAFQAIVGVWQSALRGFGPEHFAIDDRFFRAYGTFEQPNPFAGFVGMVGAVIVGVVVAGLWDWVSERLQVEGFRFQVVSYQLSVEDRAASQMMNRTPGITFYVLRFMRHIPGYLWFALPVAALASLALFASWSRGGWMGFGAAMLVVAALLPRRGWWGVVLVAVVVVGGLGLYFAGLMPASIADRLTGFLAYTTFEDVRGVGITDVNYAVVERMAHWQAALSMWQARFWLGVGFGCYEAAYPDYRLINWPIALGHAHNYYLNLLAETGIVGLVAYLALFGSVFVALFRASRRTSGWERGLALGLIGGLTHLMVHSLVDNLLVNNVHLHLGVMLALSAWVAVRSREKGCRGVAAVSAPPNL